MIPKLYTKLFIQLVVILSVLYVIFKFTTKTEVPDYTDLFKYEKPVTKQIIRINGDDLEIYPKELKLPSVNQTHLINCMKYFEIPPKIDVNDEFTYVSQVRIFNQCYFKLRAQRCSNIMEMGIYPWLNQRGSLKLSKVDQLTGELHTIDSYVPLDRDDCFLSEFKKKLKGKGIVVSATEHHFRDLLSLILLLRRLNTEYPLQIIHKGDLSDFSIERLSKIAIQDFREFEDDELVRKLFYKNGKFIDFPRLNLQFLDISNMITNAYKDKFQRFSNKLLAYFFSTFEEIILMDVDAVSFVPMDTYFNIPEYLLNGAFFFKDRLFVEIKHDDAVTEHFTKLLPKQIDYDDYGINLPTNHTLKNNFFRGFAHLAESGLLIVNKLKHFENPLMAITLNMYEDTVMAKVYGDKELYWFAMSVSGDENYSFNRAYAGSIGEPTFGKKSHFPTNPFSKEICSNHPAHLYTDLLDDKLTLYWMNTGFKYCKKILSYNENNPAFQGWSIEKFTDWNDNTPLKIRAVVIPPAPKDLIYTEPKKHNGVEPFRAWFPKDYCDSYTFCAYDYVNGDDGDYMYFYTQQEQDYFDNLGDIWMSSMKLLISTLNKDSSKQE